MSGSVDKIHKIDKAVVEVKGDLKVLRNDVEAVGKSLEHITKALSQQADMRKDIDWLRNEVLVFTNSHNDLVKSVEQNQTCIAENSKAIGNQVKSYWKLMGIVAGLSSSAGIIVGIIVQRFIEGVI